MVVTWAVPKTYDQCGVSYARSAAASRREDERGWTAHLTVDEDEPVEVVVYCPECDEREFGNTG